MKLLFLFYLFNFLTINPNNKVDFRIIDQELVYKDGYVYLEIEFSNASDYSSIVLYDICPWITRGWTPHNFYPCGEGISGFLVQISSPRNQTIDYYEWKISDSGCHLEYLNSSKECYNNKSLTDYAIVILKPDEKRRFHTKVCLWDYELKSGEYELQLIYHQNSSRFIKHKLTRNNPNLVTFSGCLFSNKVKLIKP